MKYDCINLHFTDYCNFSCRHCFVKKENNELSMDELVIIVDKIERYFKSNGINGRINIAGGEPLLSKNIDKLIDYIFSKKINISIITNGYFLDEEFIAKHKNKLYSIGISVDSLDYEANIKIGRCFKSNVLSKEKIVYLSKLIKDAGIKLKINTCVSKLNYQEDFNKFINEIKPDRFKVFQMVTIKNNTNAITEEEVKEFLSKIDYKYVYESAEDMKDSYIIIDSNGNLSTNNMHLSRLSVFNYEIEDIISNLNIEYQNYMKRYV